MESSLKICKNPNCLNPVVQPRYIYTEKPKEFCCHKCYLDNKSLNKLSPNELKEQSIQKAIDKGEKAFAGKKENDDYLVCLICGCKTAALSIHVKMHGITPTEYKTKYNLDKLVLEKFRKCGKDNPGYQHGGKYSVWSEKFVKGYDKDRHLELSKTHSEFQTDNPNNIFSRAAYDSDEEYLKFQTKDLDFFVNRYGEIDGVLRYLEKTRKWIDTMSSKSDEELNDINSRKVRHSSCFYSKAEKDLLCSIRDYGIPVSSELCLNNESRRFIYDIHYLDKIIEYNGDFWHANPNVYDSSFISPYNNLSQEEIHKRDHIKHQLARDRGYEVLVIWEQDYKKDPEKELQKCINFLTQ